MTTAILVILVLLVALGVIIALIYNGLVTRRNRVDNSWSQIDVQLKRRYDLIPNLVEAVKDYMAYEQETLTRVTEARNAAISAGARGPQALCCSTRAPDRPDRRRRPRRRPLCRLRAC